MHAERWQKSSESKRAEIGRAELRTRGPESGEDDFSKALQGETVHAAVTVHGWCIRAADKEVARAAGLAA